MRTNTTRVKDQVLVSPKPATSTLNDIRRALFACMLFEPSFYESGSAHANRLKRLVETCAVADVISAAIDARKNYNIRHGALYAIVLLVRRLNAMQRHEKRYTAGLVENAIVDVIQRADEIGEFVAMYQKVNGGTQLKRKPLAAVVKRALGRAFSKFDAYQFQKWDRKDATWRARDVMFLTHPSSGPFKASLFMALANDTMETADTWEVAYSAAGSSDARKREVWTRLLTEDKLPYFALLRNLRNMEKVGVDHDLVSKALTNRKGAEKILPFRFVAALRNSTAFSKPLNEALKISMLVAPILPGRTAVLVDVSASMSNAISAKSDLNRMDAAATLATMVRGDTVDVYSFSGKLVEVKMSGETLTDVERIKRSQPNGNTALYRSVAWFAGKGYDRIIVLTDEQDNQGRGADDQNTAPCPSSYMINVSTYATGVDDLFGWTKLNGFSEHLLQYIALVETQ